MRARRPFWIRPPEPAPLFRAFCLQGLRLTRPQCEAWWRCLVKARWSAAVSLRRQLVAQETMPATADGRRALVQQVLRPAVCIEVLEEHVQEGLLSRQRAVEIEERILQLTTRVGGWKV